jgi:hypothetical protein
MITSRFAVVAARPHTIVRTILNRAFAGHHLRVSLRRPLERHRLDHWSDTAQDAEPECRVSRRWGARERTTRMRTWPGFESSNGSSVSSSLPGLTTCTARYVDPARTIVTSLATFRVVGISAFHHERRRSSRILAISGTCSTDFTFAAASTASLCGSGGVDIDLGKGTISSYDYDDRHRYIKYDDRHSQGWIKWPAKLDNA